MTQDFRTTSPDSFRLQIAFVNTGTLKRLMGYIYEWKKSNSRKSGNLTDKQILDMERKETLIYVELMRRGVLNGKTKADFAEWKRKLQGIGPKRRR